MFKIRNILNENNLDENIRYNPAPGEVATFKNVKIILSDNERSFIVSIKKYCDLTDNFSFLNLKH